MRSYSLWNWIVFVGAQRAAPMLVLFLFLPVFMPTYAQEAAESPEPERPTPAQAMLVFLERGQPDRLQFIDIQTGEATSVGVNGERFTLFGRAVMYYDPTANRVMLATPDGRTRNHPFIQPLPSTRRIDWVVSPDGVLVAWTLTAAQADGQLVTRTQVAGIDGSNPQEVLVDEPRPGIRALPVALSADHTTLYMDYQPDGIGDVLPFRQYAGLFALDLKSGEMTMLPGEPGCFCGAGFGAGLLLRLSLAENLSGFDVIVRTLGSETLERIPAVGRADYTQASGLILSSDSTQAIYALAQVLDFGGPNQFVSTVFVHVDLVEGVQTVLTPPVSSLLEPVAWTEDDSAVIVTSADPFVNGTWKIDLEAGRVNRLANANYLGILR
jgi:hypothetical protein